jgi:hypothetical protein
MAATLTKIAQASDSDHSPPTFSNFPVSANCAIGSFIFVTCTSTIDASDGGIQQVQDDAGNTYTVIKSTAGITSGKFSTEEIWATKVTVQLNSGQNVKVQGFSRGLSPNVTIFRGDGFPNVSPAALLVGFAIGGSFDNANSGNLVIASDASCILIGIHGCGGDGSAWTPQVVSPAWSVDTALYVGGATDRTHVVQHRQLIATGTYNSNATSGQSKTWNVLMVALTTTGGTTPVTKTLTSSYSVIGRIAKNLAATYFVKLLIAKNLASTNTIHAAVVKTLAPSYKVIQRIPKVLTVTYNINAGPINTVAPLVTGTPLTGQVLSVSNGTWTNSPTSFTYVWQCEDSPGAGTYHNMPAESGSTITL